MFKKKELLKYILMIILGALLMVGCSLLIALVFIKVIISSI
jgi:hypothetical protein